MMIDLVVTRHPGLLEYLLEIDMASYMTEVTPYATKENVRGRVVCSQEGELAHSLTCLCKAYVEIPMVRPVEWWGKLLTLDQIRQCAKEAITYRVNRVYNYTV